MTSEPDPSAVLDESALHTVRGWLSRPNIVALTIGAKTVGGVPTADRAVIVHVAEKKPLAALSDADFPVPENVELHAQRPDGTVATVSLPTDVIEVGQPHPDVLNQRVRPCPGAYQIKAAGVGGAGTLGVNIVWGGRYRLLTNNHVISENKNLGAAIYQPTETADDIIGTVDGYVPVVTYPRADEPNPVFNNQDLAYANVGTDLGAPTIYQIGLPKGLRLPKVGEWVTLIGKQTATVKRAKIAAVTLSLTMEWLPSKWAWFHTMIQLDAKVTQPGDSGSAYHAETDGMIVGLHVGSTNTYSFGCQLWPL